MIEPEQAATTEDLLRRNPSFDPLDMRKDLKVALGARAEIDMSAFAGDGNPGVERAHEAGDAEPGAGPQHHLGVIKLGFAAADLNLVFTIERRHGQRLRLEIVDDHNLFEAEIGKQVSGPHHPWAVGQGDFVAIDGTGDGKDGRPGLDPDLAEHGVIYRRVDRGIVGRLDDRDVAECRGAFLDQAETGIGAADIADQDREGEVIVTRLGHRCPALHILFA